MTSSAPAAADRFVRVCRTHRLPLKESPKGELVCPRGHPILGWLTLDREKRLVISESDKGKGEVAMMRAKADEGAAAAGEADSKRTVLRSKFTNAPGEKLFVRLLYKPPKYGGDAFHVVWQIVAVVGGKNASRGSGVCATCPDEASGRKRYAQAQEDAKQQKWTSSPILFGRHARVFKPIPPAAAALRAPRVKR